ncbi:MAG TPA: limonene-1,2-epoxide hydrolase family protein [Microthrixaceae bacterium]|nr:limonene-1,2-epoxide hydrolase family protein [Microthrixaceae bacterium]
MTPLPHDPDLLVRAFCEAVPRADLDEILGFMADDAVYHNIPMEPSVGHEAIRTFLEGFLGMASSLDFVIHRQLAVGNLVMNERTDTMTIGDKTISLPVAGAFEIANGKIAAWRDYFDMGQFLNG